MATNEWVTAAMTDDALVVELLFRLKQSWESYAFVPAYPPPLAIPPGWGHHRPRSRPAEAAAAAAAASASRKESEPTRCSPTTPLSWSGGSASPSDGYDDSSRCFVSRSKGTFTNETNTAIANKRSRKKKTFAELKEDENLLLKERVHLKKELESIRVTIEEQRARSENLKRIKLDMHSQSANKKGFPSDEQGQAISSQPNLDHVNVFSTTDPTLDSSKVQEDMEITERCFFTPDLNMTPSEEESGSDTLYGMS